jgi:hypothetical protein
MHNSAHTQQIDAAVEALSTALKAAGVHPSQTNPAPLRENGSWFINFSYQNRSTQSGNDAANPPKPLHTPPTDPPESPVAGLRAPIAPAGTYPSHQKPPERPGRTLFTVLNESARGWMGREKETDADTMKRVDNLLITFLRGG